MRHSELRWLGPLALLLTVGVLGSCLALTTQACVVPLDNEFSDAGADAATDANDGARAADGSATPDPGCPPFETVAPASSLRGDLRSIVQSDGTSLWIIDQATLPDAGVAPGAFVVGSGARADCSGWSAKLAGPAFAPSPLEPDGLLAPLDLVGTPSGLALYYQLFVADPTQPFGIREVGVGLAPRNAASGRFEPTSELLWSPDRPSYGTSALLVGTTVYAFGCASTGAFSANCFVARADAADLASTAAYAYWNGESWSSDIDDAAPITEAGGTVSVRADPTGETRYIMTFVPPLAGTLVAQSAPAPEGPWSASVTLATCALSSAGAGAFCAGGQQHPELSGTSGRLVLSYDARTFTSDGGAASGAFWPHLVALEVPPSLP